MSDLFHHLFLLLSACMKLRPLGDRIVVAPTPKEEITKSGIILPDTVSKERPEQGEVIEVGPGKLLESGTRSAMSVKVGDKVMFKKYSPDEFKMDDKEYLVLSESDVIAVIE